MKQIWPDYSYSPATNVLTLTGLNIDRDQLLLVAAPERGRIMYNFADSAVTASAFTSGANTSLTLVATTAGLTTTAALVIYYDDQLQSTSVSISNFPASQAVTFSAVSISNFPATQTIAGTVTVGSLPAISGTVTANLSSTNLNTVTIGVRGSVTVGNTTQITDNVVAGFNNTFGNNDTLKVDIRTPDGSVLDGEASVPVQGTVDIGSLPAISGTVTANVRILDTNSGSNVVFSEDGGTFPDYGLQVGFVDNLDYRLAGSSHPFPISGTVTVGNSVTIASFATSVTARLINPAGTAVTYAEVGTAGSPSIDVLSVQGVTSGTAIAISGTVTANLAISSTVITSGSFTSLASATLVPANTARKMATVYNLGAGQLFVNAGATATTLGGGFMVALSSGDFYECDYTTTTLSAIFATAGTASWMSH
jgi:hypothetical protein